MQSALKVHLLVIDPQNDFIDTPNSPGSLAVPGAYNDSLRLAGFITRIGQKLDDIHVTMDCHHILDVAHPLFWKNSASGKNPNPFTVITEADISGNMWVPQDQSLIPRMLKYVKALETSHRYPLMIWPPHCLIGSPGNNVQKDIYDALCVWEKANIAQVDYVTKGSNPFTEHYSAVKAEVPDLNDPSTNLNTTLINILSGADQILIAGQALSHCVANTVRDIADNFGDDNVKKMVLLEDCSSNVPNCEQMGADFIKDMTKRGMKVTTTVAYMA